MTEAVFTLNIPPGIQRDGTLFDSVTCVDGRWVRWQRNRPRKMGGFNGIFRNANGISRGMAMNAINGLNYIVSGWSDGLERWQTDSDDAIGAGPFLVPIEGGVVTYGNLTAGSGYTNGAHPASPLLGGSGTGAEADITVAGGLVTVVVITDAGADYVVGDVLTANAAAIGAGTGFSITVTAVDSFTVATDNLWQLDIGFDKIDEVNYLLAHPGRNLTDISNSIDTPVLYGPFPDGPMAVLQDTGGSTPTGDTIEVSGGAVMLYPYLFVYGNNGRIRNSSAGNFTDWNSADSNDGYFAASKIVRGLPVRGGTNSPSGLFWSLDSIVRVSFTGPVGSPATYWRYDLLTNQTSIMSSSCVIEYDGIYYWCGVDRFLAYNGVVQEIPNTQNQNYFFDNLNYNQRQKVWASKIPRFGEIWWFYPKGDATECNDAIIYNVREKVWYDAGTAIGARRSAGVFSEVFRYPIWGGNDINDADKYTLWQHERGVNQVELTNVNAIESYWETPSIGWVNGGPGANEAVGKNRYIDLSRIEPDFVQAGVMSVVVTGKGYASEDDEESDPQYFDPSTLKVDIRQQRREMRLRFISNVANGNYEGGRILLSAELGDERSTGNP